MRAELSTALPASRLDLSELDAQVKSAEACVEKVKTPLHPGCCCRVHIFIPGTGVLSGLAQCLKNTIESRKPEIKGNDREARDSSEAQGTLGLEC